MPDAGALEGERAWTRCGMVGIAERGPINKPVLVTSWEQFVKAFGGYIQHGYLAYAARAFFDNGGSVLHVCRVAYYTDPTRRATLTAVPMHLEPSEAVEFRRGEGPYTHAAFNSSCAALYYPWIEISDLVSGKRKLVPPTGAVAGCIARSDEKTYVWYAPAGIDRGRVFNALSVAYKTSRGERDVLYPEGINVIAVFPATGINIWGQRTPSDCGGWISDWGLMVSAIATRSG